MVRSVCGRRWLVILAVVVGMLVALGRWSARAGEPVRFFHHGNGRIDLVNAKTGARFDGIYRRPDGRYDPAALAAIQHVFGADCGRPACAVSLRLVEFLDFLQDRLRPGARILIVSGWRSPEYNRKLRAKGGIVAKASLHQYGMAADIIMEGVAAGKLWDYVRSLKFGGVGYYHGKMVHLDVGPARFWDETTSKVHTNISDHNKRIALVTDYDRYRPGETVTLRFVRMTAFPIGVRRRFVLERENGGRSGYRQVVQFEPSFAAGSQGRCPTFVAIDEMLAVTWRLPRELMPGRYRIRARFCGRRWPDMPREVATAEFAVGSQAGG